MTDPEQTERLTLLREIDHFDCRHQKAYFYTLLGADGILKTIIIMNIYSTICALVDDTLISTWINWSLDEFSNELIRF